METIRYGRTTKMIKMKCDDCKLVKEIAYSGKKTLCSDCYRKLSEKQKLIREMKNIK